MAQHIKTNGVILRRTNYGEADRIITFLSPDNGQLSALARSVRRERSKLAGGIELLSICEFNLVRGNNNIDGLWTLTGARIITYFDQIVTNYERMQFSYDFLKLVARLGDSIDTPELYYILTDGLAGLNNMAIDLKLVQAWCYLRLARLQGGELNLITDNNGMQLVEGADYNFDKSEGVFIYAPQGGQYDSETIKLLRLMTVNPPTVLSKIRGITSDTIQKVLFLTQYAIESI